MVKLNTQASNQRKLILSTTIFTIEAMSNHNNIKHNFFTLNPQIKISPIKINVSLSLLYPLC
jgi:hypothetical protein